MFTRDFLLGILSIFLFPLCVFAQDKPDLATQVTQGALRIISKGEVVECPLKHTDVSAEIAGFVARVKVVQTFTNPTNEKIEAVYVFPLPQESAVDSMTMLIGNRKIVGTIKRRAEAKALYELALSMGQTAALLEQERSNIFTQTVGNIEPGQDIKIEISYIDVLKYDMGTYEFHFPVVVGPRYIPGGGKPIPNAPGVTPSVAPTPAVPDANRITPPYTPTRNGADISLSVKLDAGVPIQELKSANHEVDAKKISESSAEVKIKPSDTIPNKDFVLRYKVMGKQTEMALLSHHPQGPYEFGYYMLMIQPHEDEKAKEEQPPREMVFMVDVSGSMGGEPTEKNKEMMREMLALCREKDTLQVITFASITQKLFEKPFPVNEANIQKALSFTNIFAGGGGTEMLKGVQAAINEPKDKDRRRIVVMLTDGFIGNEAQILEEVGKNCGDDIRFWCVGIGSAPNMMLIDGVAKQGGGMGKILTLTDPAKPLATELMFRIQSAQLSKIKIDYGTLGVSEQYPPTVGDLWFGQPIVVFGKYSSGKSTAVTVTGEIEGKPVTMKMNLALPDVQPQNDGLAKIWARKKIEDLMQSVYYATGPTPVEHEVTELALEYSLMSQYTSFIAADDSEVKQDAKPPRRIAVPLPIPDGTQWEGLFGPDEKPDPASIVRPEGMSDEDWLKYRKQVLEGDAISGGRVSMGDVGSYSGRSTEEALMARRRMQVSGYAGSGIITETLPATPPAPLSTNHIALPNVALPQVTVRSGGLYRTAPQTLGRMPVNARFGTSSIAAYSVYGVTAPSTQPSRVYYWSDVDTDGASFNYRVSEIIRDLSTDMSVEGFRESLMLALNNDYAPAMDLLWASEQTRVDSLIREQQALKQAWLKQIQQANPALNRKLSVVIRSASLAEAIKTIDPTIVIADGALQDAATLLMQSEMRVPYADLNGFTLSEALEDLLTPANLRWTVHNGKITVYSKISPDQKTGWWVYPLNGIPWLAAGNKMEISNGIDLTSTLQKELNSSDSLIRWTRDGNLLLKGDAATHAKFAQILSDLTDPKAKLAGNLVELQKTYLKRIEDRKIVSRQTMILNAEKPRIAQAMNEYGWRLLSAAAKGVVDDEAICQLADAFKSPAASELAKSNPQLVLRTLWIMKEADQTLFAPRNGIPNERKMLSEATLLATTLAKPLSPDFTKPVKRDETLKAIYYALAFGAADTIRFEDASIDPLYASLMKSSRAEYGKLVMSENPPSGDDWMILTAIACRKSGDETWNQFRSNRAALMNSRVSGDVIVLIHNLSAKSLSIVR